MEFIYKSQADITAMTDSEREDYATKKRAHEEALIEKKAKEEAEKLVAKAKEESTEAIKKAKEENEEAIKKAKEETSKEIANLSAAVKKASQISKTDPEKVTMEHVIKTIIEENKDSITGFKGKSKETFVSKALAPSNFGAGNYADITTERRTGIYIDPYAPVWLRNIFPNATTTSETISYLRRKAATGKAAVWKRSSGEDKPDVTPNFEKATATVEWIAGLTDVPREMLQDVAWLGSYIPNELIYSDAGILAAENAFIMDYIEANAVDFTGTETNGLEKVLAAAFGQIGSKYMRPSHILINNWDYLTYLAFNKADGSGEYDHPNFNIAMVNGQMTINNLIAIGIPDVEQGTAYVVAADQSQFVTRMSTEVQMFDQHNENVAKNLVTFRAEERVTFFTHNVNSLVKVALAPVVEPEE